MKKVPFKKLALTAETIRNLTAAELRSVGGQVLVVVVNTVITTTHSIASGCITHDPTTPANPSGQGD